MLAQQRIYNASVAVFLLSVLSSCFIAFVLPLLATPEPLLYTAREYNIQTGSIAREYEYVEGLQQEVTRPTLFTNEEDPVEYLLIPQNQITFTIDDDEIRKSNASEGYTYIQVNEEDTLDVNDVILIADNSFLVDINDNVIPLFDSVVVEDITIQPGQAYDIANQEVVQFNLQEFYREATSQDVIALLDFLYEVPELLEDTQAPQITILSSVETTTEPTYELFGEVSEPAEVQVNNELVRLDDGLRFIVEVELEEGENVIEIVARDQFGNESEEVVVIEYVPPPVSFPVSFSI